ncbi:MAG: sigma-E processing peptidase SpoIIGA [Bacillota bacterium]|nr:sigma-E processing peptidase SpoIIGA [Bacillota bacterium]
MLKTVYIEYVLIDNFIMNFLILRLAAEICGKIKKHKRIALSSAMGAAYAAVAFIPGFGFLYILPVKIAVSAVMAAVAFGWGGIRHFTAGFAAFIGVTFVFGGAALGLAYALDGSVQNGVIYFDGTSYRALVISGIVSIVLVAAIRRAAREAKAKGGYMYPLKLVYGGKSIFLESYLDTGNMLCETVSNLPVIIAEYDRIKRVLPHWMGKSMFDDSFNQRTAKTLGIFEKKLYLLPYAALGKKGIMLGIKPDLLEIYMEGSWRKVEAVLGITRYPLQGGMEALLNPKLIDRAIKV